AFLDAREASSALHPVGIMASPTTAQTTAAPNSTEFRRTRLRPGLRWEPVGGASSCVAGLAVTTAIAPRLAQKSHSVLMSLIVVRPAPRNAASIATNGQQASRNPERAITTSATSTTATYAARPKMPV